MKTDFSNVKVGDKFIRVLAGIFQMEVIVTKLEEDQNLFVVHSTDSPKEQMRNVNEMATLLGIPPFDKYDLPYWEFNYLGEEVDEEMPHSPSYLKLLNS